MWWGPTSDRQTLVKQVGLPLSQTVQQLFQHTALVRRIIWCVLAALITRLVQQRCRVWSQIGSTRDATRYIPDAKEKYKAPKQQNPVRRATIDVSSVCSRPKSPTPVLLKMFSDPDGLDIGFAELAASAVISAIGCAITVRRAVVAGSMLVTQGLRRGAVASGWPKHAIEYLLLAAASSTLTSTHKFLQSAVALKWRRNVTHQLHDMYFIRMSYFRIQHENAEAAVHEADVRIAQDVRDMANATSQLAISLVDAVVKVVVFGAVTVLNHHWVWALSSPLFFAATVKTILQMEPAHGSKVHAELKLMEVKFWQHLANIQKRARNICMMRGESFELDHLQRSVRDIRHHVKRKCDVMFLMDLCEWVFFRSPQAASCVELVAFFSAACTGVSVPAKIFRNALGSPSPAQRMGIQIRDLYGFYNACAGWTTLLSARSNIVSCNCAAYRVKQMYARLEKFQTPGQEGRRKKKNRAKRSSTASTMDGGDPGAVIAAASQDVFVDGGSRMVGFDGVLIATPAHVPLLRDLTFRLFEGHNCLACGPSGSGKTAIARALCALWAVGGGQISRPGGAGSTADAAALRGEVVYLPRRPCNAIGSLSDNLTYPFVVPGGLPREELRRWLSLVGLESYLNEEMVAQTEADAHGMEVQPVDWASRLTLADQQAFSFLRLFYQRPRFAILDDCLTALESDSQKRLYSCAQEVGITCVIMSRKPIFENMFSYVLSLSGGDLAPAARGWKFSESPVGKEINENRLKRGRCLSPVDAIHRIEAHMSTLCVAEGCHEHLENTTNILPPTPHFGHCSPTDWPPVDEPDQSCFVTITRTRWPNQVKRMLAVIQLGLQTQSRRRSAAIQSASVLALLALRTCLYWAFCRSLCGMSRASLRGELPAIFSELLINSGVVCASGLADQAMKVQVGYLAADVWHGFLNHVLRRLIRTPVLYRLAGTPFNLDDAFPSLGEDCVQRLAETRALFESLRSQLCHGLVHGANLVVFLPTLLNGLGWSAALPLAMHVLLIRLCQRYANESEVARSNVDFLEERFQSAHTRVNKIAEQVAFASGGPTEKFIVDQRFQALLDGCMHSNLVNLPCRALKIFVTDRRLLPFCIQRLLSFHFCQRYLASVTGVAPPRTVEVMCSGLLFDFLVQAAHGALLHFAQLPDRFPKIDASCTRCLELLVACDARPTSPLMSPSHLSPICERPGIYIKGLNLRYANYFDASTDPPLASNLNFCVESGVSLLVTGPSGSGKSSLTCVLAGLARPPGEFGSVVFAVPTFCNPPGCELMVVPQTPYLLSSGRLVSLLAYPKVVRWPTVSPHQLRIANVGSALWLTEQAIMNHFAPLGATECSMPSAAHTSLPDGTEAPSVLLNFKSMADLLKAVAKPQERVIDGFELHCEVVAGDVNADSEESCSHVPDLTRMRNCLRAVELDELLQVEQDGWFARRHWDDVLNLGEKQRLCIARLLYHGPRFAVLDDCLSSLPLEQERELVINVLPDWGVTPIVMSQQPLARDFFDQHLKLGEPTPERWALHEKRACLSPRS